MTDDSIIVMSDPDGLPWGCVDLRVTDDEGERLAVALVEHAEDRNLCLDLQCSVEQRVGAVAYQFVLRRVVDVLVGRVLGPVKAELERNGTPLTVRLTEPKP